MLQIVITYRVEVETSPKKGEKFLRGNYDSWKKPLIFGKEKKKNGTMPIKHSSLFKLTFLGVLQFYEYLQYIGIDK